MQSIESCPHWQKDVAPPLLPPMEGEMLKLASLYGSDRCNYVRILPSRAILDYLMMTLVKVLISGPLERSSEFT